MRKLFILFIFLITFSLGAQTYEYDGDVWNLSTDIDTDTKSMYCGLDIEQSAQEDFDPREWGIHSALFTMIQYKNGSLILAFSYMTNMIEYALPHYILISNEDFDFQMYGGQKTNGDRSLYQEDKEKNVAFNIIYITLSGEKRKQFLSIEEDKKLWIEEMEYNHGIVYGFPKEIISEFNMFIEETEYEEEFKPDIGPDFNADELESVG